MAYIIGHGGGCCGIRHLRSFTGEETKEGIKELLASHTRQSRTQGMLVEAVLTNVQLRSHPDLAKNLQEVGFKLVSRFRNPNSGNICNVFHYNQAPRGLTARLPFRPVAEVRDD